MFRDRPGEGWKMNTQYINKVLFDPLFQVMHVRGHFIPLSDPEAADVAEPQPTSGGQGQGQGQGQQGQGQQGQGQRYVFMATCSPLITPELKENLIQSNTMVFKTVHQLDMSFLEVTKT